jgi:hypothetical protein
MRTRPLALSCLVLLLSVSASRPAAADPVRLDFYITLTSTFGDLSALHGSPLGPGDRIRGSLVYDPSAPVLRPELPYAEFRPAGSLTLGFGSGIVIPLEGMVVAEPVVINGITQPSMIASSGNLTGYPGFDSIMAELEFRGTQSGLTLPPSAAEFLARYPRGYIRGAAWQQGVPAPFDSGTQEFYGTVAPVPEPATLLLLGGGVAVLLKRRWA